MYKQNFELPYFCKVEINEGSDVAIWVQRTTNTSMSIAQNPVTGQMSKSYANVNTYVHKGQNVVSAKAFNRKDKNTDAQKAQRSSFKLIADIYGSLGGYAELGFPVRPERQSAYNAFVAANLPSAIDITGEIPVIDYSNLKIAKGSLIGVLVLSAIVADGALTLTGKSNSDFPKANATDLIRLVVKTTVGNVYAAEQLRGIDNEMLIVLPMQDVSPQDIECAYVFVTTSDGKKASNSVYVPVDN